MRKTASGLMLWASCLCVSPALAATSVATRVVSGGVNIQATATVDADPQTLWSTLTDYNALARFVPGMSSSRVVSAPGVRPKLVEQTRASGLLSLIIPDYVVLAMHEQPLGRIGFRSIAGWSIAMSGEWLITGGRPLRLSYRARIVPLLPPPLVTDRYIEDEVRLRMDALACEAERRIRSRRWLNMIPRLVSLIVRFPWLGPLQFRPDIA